MTDARADAEENVMNQLINETFALRNGESIQVFDAQPTEGRWVAVCSLPCPFPHGPVVPIRERDGAPVEQQAIVAAELTEDGWQWLPLSQPTKEAIADHLFDVVGAKPHMWYYLTITDSSPMIAT